MVVSGGKGAVQKVSDQRGMGLDVETREGGGVSESEAFRGLKAGWGIGSGY